MFGNLKFSIRKFLFQRVIFAALVTRRIMNFALNETTQSIPLERQRRALATTVDYVERHMRHVDSVGCKYELLTRAFKRANVSGDRLVCEFGVFMGASINHIAKLAAGPVFGFDSFEGLPERWLDGQVEGTFAVPKLPGVRENVTLIKGWFNETLPPFRGGRILPKGISASSARQASMIVFRHEDQGVLNEWAVGVVEGDCEFGRNDRANEHGLPGTHGQRRGRI